MKEFSKDPSAILDYVFDWSRWLDTGETIAAHTLTVDTGLTLDSSSVTTTAITVWLSGGTTRSIYKVACRITTTAGRTDERTMVIKVTNR